MIKIKHENKRAELLDRGEWKHTWHMKTDEYGRIDWSHPDNVAVVRREIAIARNQAKLLEDLAAAAFELSETQS